MNVTKQQIRQAFADANNVLTAIREIVYQGDIENDDLWRMSEHARVLLDLWPLDVNGKWTVPHSQKMAELMEQMRDDYAATNVKLTAELDTANRLLSDAQQDAAEAEATIDAARNMTPEAVVEAWANFERLVGYIDKERAEPSQWLQTMRDHAFKQSVEILTLRKQVSEMEDSLATASRFIATRCFNAAKFRKENA